MDGFAKTLGLADHILLLPIYPARELPIEGITSEVLASKIPIAIVVQKDSLARAVKNTNATVVLVVGAGDIGDLVPEIKAEFT
jgi:UDP-N-acetylmuramate--alanine ligase